MGLRINNNIQSVNGHRNLQRNDAMAGRSMEKLSSGLRINKAADDAAGLIISEQMRAQIAGLSQAISNSETAVNLVQTAEGALDEMNTLMKKARTLALHAANEGANDQSILVADQSELDNIISSVTRIAETTQFGNKKLMDGSLQSFRSASSSIGNVTAGNDYKSLLASKSIVRGYHSVQITQQATQGNLYVYGTLGSGTILTGRLAGLTFDIENMSGTTQFGKTFTVAVNGVNLTVTSGQTKNDLVNALNAIGKTAGFKALIVTGTAAGATNTLMSGASQLAGTGNIALINDTFGSGNMSLAFVGGATGGAGLSGTYTSGDVMCGNLFLNTGVVGGTANSGSRTIALTQSGKSLTLVSSAGSGYRIDLKSLLTVTGANTTGGTFYGVIDGMSAGASFQIGSNVGQKVSVELNSMSASALGTQANDRFRSLADLTGTSLVGGNADSALTVIDKAIADVTSTRGRLGAFQGNTLESGLNSLRISKENLTGAESTIRDVDFAEESSSFTKYQILVQASTAMLAQANQLPQNVLKLLG